MLVLLLSLTAFSAPLDNVAVRFWGQYSELNTTFQHPDKPAFVREIGASIECPQDFTPCAIMSKDEYKALKKNNDPAWNEWTCDHGGACPLPEGIL